MNDPMAVVYLAIGNPKSKIKPSLYYKYLYIGNGKIVIDQEPAFGERIPEGGTIILYLG